MKTRADQLFDNFKKFHRENPRVWELFKILTDAVIQSGKRRYSSDAICHRIRWHFDIEQGEGKLKLNDHVTTFYSRLWSVANPDRAGFFHLRRRPSQHRQINLEHDIIPAEESIEEPLKAELLKLLASQSPDPDTAAPNNLVDTALAPVQALECNSHNQA